MIGKLLSNRTILNIISVGSITFLVKGLAFYKEMTIGSTFGLSVLLDTFLIATLIPGFINSVFSSSFQNVFVPNYINHINCKSNSGDFQTTSFFLSIVLAIFLSIIAYIFSDVLLEYIFPNKSIEYYFLIRKQFYVLLPCIVILERLFLFISQ